MWLLRPIQSHGRQVDCRNAKERQMRSNFVATLVLFGSLLGAIAPLSAQSLGNAYAAPGYVPSSDLSGESRQIAQPAAAQKRVPVVRRFSGPQHSLGAGMTLH